MLNLSALRRGRILLWRVGILSLALLAVAGMGIGRALYPPENRFSVMTSTMSFLGSPEAHRNPDGWRYWQAGSTGALLLLTLLASQRVSARIGQPRCLVVAASTAYGAALALILAATWIPLSKNPFWGGTTCAAIHNHVTIAGIFTMIAAVTLDGITLLVARARPRLLAPFALLGIITACGLASLAFWRWKCAADPSLRIFPGEGIHSTPMWEWIAFACLCLFLAAQALAARSLPPDPHRTHCGHPCCEPMDDTRMMNACSGTADTARTFISFGKLTLKP